MLFAFSRGAYLGFAFGMVFLGVLRERKLLLLLAVLIIGWSSIVPTAVNERIFSTYQGGQIESSANERVTIWEDAVTLIPQHPILGTGFDTYEFMGRVDEFRDTHNLYLKIIVETGFVGLIVFLVLLWKTFRMSFSLFRASQDPFFQSLGLGTTVYIFCVFIVNFFGDRWMYLQVSGYLWVILGLVARAHLLNQEETTGEVTEAVGELEPNPYSWPPPEGSPVLPHV